jgi:uncharacterized membrane protein
MNEEFPAQPPVSVPPPVSTSSGLSDTAAAALAYVTIIPAILFLVLEPYNKKPFIRFHSFQSIGLAVVWIVVWISVWMVHAILHFIPLIGLLFVFVYLAFVAVFFIAWLMCIIKASQGQWFKLPVIGDFALKQSQS